MENLSNPEENDYVSFRQSPGSIDPNDHSASETPVYSTMSTDSFAYHGTCSETSGGFSDQIDETSSFCSEVSPSAESSNCLTTLEMKQNLNESKENLAVQEILEPGFVSLSLFLCLYFHFVKILKLLSVLCRIGDDEGKILKASAWRRYVRKRQRRLHRSDNLKRYNQSLW